MPVPSHSPRSHTFLSNLNNIKLLGQLGTKNSRQQTKAYSCHHIEIKQSRDVHGVCETHVPLLYLLNISAHWVPVVASRFATMFLTHSKTVPVGWTCFHSAGLLLPMVVSMVTWRHPIKTRIKASYSAVVYNLLHWLWNTVFSPSHYLRYKNHLQRRLIQDMMRMPEFHQEEDHYLK